MVQLWPMLCNMWWWNTDILPDMHKPGPSPWRPPLLGTGRTDEALQSTCCMLRWVEAVNREAMSMSQYPCSPTGCSVSVPCVIEVSAVTELIFLRLTTCFTQEHCFVRASLLTIRFQSIRPNQSTIVRIRHHQTVWWNTTYHSDREQSCARGSQLIFSILDPVSLLFFRPAVLQGAWTDWSDFSPCSSSCGLGSQVGNCYLFYIAMFPLFAATRAPESVSIMHTSSSAHLLASHVAMWSWTTIPWGHEEVYDIVLHCNGYVMLSEVESACRSMHQIAGLITQTNRGGTFKSCKHLGVHAGNASRACW